MKLLECAARTELARELAGECSRGSTGSSTLPWQNFCQKHGRIRDLTSAGDSLRCGECPRSAKEVARLSTSRLSSTEAALRNEEPTLRSHLPSRLVGQTPLSTADSRLPLSSARRRGQAALQQSAASCSSHLRRGELRKKLPATPQTFLRPELLLPTRLRAAAAY